MNKFLCALALCIPLITIASPGDDGCVGNCDGGSNSAPITVTSTNNNTNLNSNIVTVKPIIDANARARAEAYAASLSEAKSTSQANNTNATTALAGGSVSSITTGDTTVNTNYPNKQRIYNVPNVSLPAVYPTSPCMGSTSIGGSGVGFGIGFGTSWTDDECGIRETARSFNGLGLKDDAVSVLCTSKYASVAKACQKEETQK